MNKDLPLTIKPQTPEDGRCPLCGRPCAEFYELSCSCCRFEETCCRGCASPEALRAIADVMLWQDRQARRLLDLHDSRN